MKKSCFYLSKAEGSYVVPFHKRKKIKVVNLLGDIFMSLFKSKQELFSINYFSKYCSVYRFSPYIF